MDTGKGLKVRRIAIVGPECTGKTDLARFLAEQYNTAWVPEFARTYLETLDREYTQADLPRIAKGQGMLEDSIAEQANRFLFCDTNLVVIKIWSEFKYGSCDPAILKELRERTYHLHLLTDVDLPWEDDPLREHPHQRHELFALYEAELKNSGVRYHKIGGDYATRRAAALAAIDQ
jgi:NadR type nicotinamide-nucleotide adenylyltransferase